MKGRIIICFLLSGLFIPGLFITASAQEIVGNENIRQEAISVYIDCHHCDMDHIRRNIPYINYVRDVKEAEVYVLETSQSAGSGGRKYTYRFEGLKQFEGMTDTLSYEQEPEETSEVTREGRTNMLAMGLMRYVARSKLKNTIRINSIGDFEEEEVVDKWNYWVFDLSMNFDIEGEESYEELGFENSINISRVTEEWKLDFDFEIDENRQKYKYDDTTYTTNRSSTRFENLIVKSLTNHWSVGMELDASSSSYSNSEFTIDVFPVLEYNIFPYSESTFHSFSIQYGLGYSYNDYYETTIYDKDKESLFRQELEIDFRMQQKWGSVNFSLEGSNYLQDFSKNRISFDGNLRIRIIKGLSLSLGGEVARIRNLISLPKGEMSEAERLLRLQQMATGYSYETRIGISYTFGSIYNNVVNPRISRW